MKTARKRRPWTMKDVRILLAMKYAGRTNRQILEALGRTSMSDLYRLWNRFGAPRRQHRLTPKREARLRRLHAAGLSQQEIADRMRFGHRTVQRWMQRLGLPANAHSSEHIRAKNRAARLRVWKQLGRNLTQARVEVWRARAAAMGWPQAESPRQARVLTLLETGPRTIPEIARELKLPTSVPYYLQRLRVLGLVESTRGKGRAVYRLAPGVRRGPQLGERR